jgi:hypothetical protein
MRSNVPGFKSSSINVEFIKFFFLKIKIHSYLAVIKQLTLSRVASKVDFLFLSNFSRPKWVKAKKAKLPDGVKCHPVNHL